MYYKAWELAFKNVEYIEKDGFMSIAYNLDDGKATYGEGINLPLMAWAEWEHYLVSGDSSRFEEILPALEGIYSFIEKTTS